MNMMKKIGVLLWLCALSSAAISNAVQADDILGVWNNAEKDGKIEIFKCDGKYCGKIVWAKEPNYPAGSKEGTPGTPRIDYKNPDATKKVEARSRPSDHE